MVYTLAFDVYGTLIDTSGVFSHLRKLIGDHASDFMHTWRSKQLEYSFRHGLMLQFVDFSVCTRNALDYCCKVYNHSLSTEQREVLMGIYRVLPAFSDVQICLEEVRKAGHRAFAFSNGNHAAVSQLLENADLSRYFDGIVSVEKVKMFKPSPLVYAHFNDITSSSKEQSWLISGNSFDISGAMAYGMRAVWVRRTEEHFFDEGWEQPTKTISTMQELVRVIRSSH